MSIMISGDKELLRDLKKLADGVLEDKVFAALEKGGEWIKEESKKRVPVDKGKLKDSIKIQKSRKKMWVKVLAAKIRKHSYYAFAVEFGTKKQKAQPFLLPAERANEAAIIAAIEKAIAEAIE